MKIRRTAIRLLLFLITLILAYPTDAQSVITPLAAASNNVQQKDQRTVDASPQLYNGPEYIDYAQRYQVRNGHQFFLLPDKQPGSVYYNDHSFAGLSMQYDVVLGQLVLQHVTSPLSLHLINEHVRSFTLAGHHFIRLVTDSSASAVVQTGYYEVLVDSTVQLLAKRVKQLHEKINQNRIEAEFLPTDKLFIRKAGVYYSVNKKRSVTQVFSDRSKEVQKYIQDNKLKFKKARREADIVQLTRYYAGLSPQ
ncbi:hypothetical protein [Hymenobacter sp. GOD-10R]|uniref:hypothetical protein n=1 Tax=Hymenobacter sp. GOD-10R TaxID=3093922 RepID=UPI002D7934EB|nr:hypothetical protein [Hymenobacter sp. GOD-10R]WRQ28164.1 hypothetical protein SD425_24165 [Hymenobacter sp. GOD-10R]